MTEVTADQTSEVVDVSAPVLPADILSLVTDKDRADLSRFYIIDKCRTRPQVLTLVQKGRVAILDLRNSEQPRLTLKTDVDAYAKDMRGYLDKVYAGIADSVERVKVLVFAVLEKRYMTQRQIDDSMVLADYLSDPRWVPMMEYAIKAVQEQSPEESVTESTDESSEDGKEETSV